MNAIMHRVFISLLCLAFFTQHHVLGVYPRVACVGASSLFVAEQRPVVWTCHAVYHTLCDGDRGCPLPTHPEQRYCECLWPGPRPEFSRTDAPELPGNVVAPRLTFGGTAGPRSEVARLL